VAAGEERHQDLIDDCFLANDTFPDFGAQPRCSSEKILAR
jgi:hypothetical protein